MKPLISALYRELSRLEVSYQDDPYSGLSVEEVEVHGQAAVRLYDDNEDALVEGEPLLEWLRSLEAVTFEVLWEHLGVLETDLQRRHPPFPVDAVVRESVGNLGGVDPVTYAQHLREALSSHGYNVEVEWIEAEGVPLPPIIYLHSEVEREQFLFILEAEADKVFALAQSEA